MSMRILSGWRELDNLAAVLTFAMAVILLPLQLFVSSIFVRTIPLALGIASLLYLVGDEHHYGTPQVEQWRFSPGAAHLVRLTTVVGFAGMIFIGTLTGGRTVPFFIAAAIVGSLVFAQIFFHERATLRPPTILAQIIVFALIVRGMALVMTPGMIGVDVWVHITDYAQSIREAGSLSAIADVKYFGAPLYHLFVVAAAEAFQVPLKVALYLTLGVVMPLATIAVYFLARYFFPVRWALFAGAAFIFADHVIRWGIHLIPTSLGLVFFVVLCYLIGKIHATRGSPALYAFALFFAIATVLTHQVSTFIVLLFLGCGTIAQIYAKFVGTHTSPGARGTLSPLSKPDVNFAALFVIVMPITLINWSLSPTSRETPFLETMISVGQSALATADVLNTPGSASTSMGPIESLLVTAPVQYQLLDALGLLLLLVITLVGTFAVLRRKRLDSLTLAWVLSAGVMLFATLGLPLLEVNFFLPNRWYAFMYVPMIILGTYGLRHISLNFPKRKLLAVLVVFALVFPGAMLVHYKATPDNPVNEQYHHQYAYSESELNAAETISSIHPDTAVLTTDHPYRLLFRDWQQQPTAMMNLSDNGSVRDVYTVYRSSQSEEGPQVEYRSEAPRVQLPPDSVCRPNMEVVYANSDVKYCRAT